MSGQKKYNSGVSNLTKGVQPAAQLNSSQPLNFILPLAVAIITFIVYRYTLHNQFLDWDDWIYVQKDPYITSFSAHNLSKLLFGNVTENYYHPITMLSLALNYHFSKLDPAGYYFTNILIHAANTAVIFFLVKTLLENMSKSYGYGPITGIPWLAALCALFHGVHPMHVESVAWMVERKDVLYGFFYFLGLIMYVKYVNAPSLKSILPVAVLYGCSLLSKPMAVSFPLSLFAIDVLLKRTGLRNLILEKWPFFLLSVAGGILTFFTQKASGSIAFLNGYTLLSKLMIPFYSFFIYFAKAFVPLNLSSYYPYPPITSQGYLPVFFYVCPLVVAILVSIPLYLSYKAGNNYFRVVVFGLGFFFANVVFILQFLSSGVAVVAERYSYVAYFGLFFMLAYFIFVLINKFKAYRVPVIAITAVFVSTLAYICDGRTRIWHDSETLWKNVIKNHPGEWETPYVNMGQYYVDKGQMDSAFDSYDELVKMHTNIPEVYRNLANIYAMRKQYDASIQLYAYAIKYDSTGSGDTYLDRAVTYSIMGKPNLAIKDYNYAYSKDTNSEKILVNRSYTYLSMGQYDMAIKDYSHLIRINPAEASYYFRRGIAEANKGMVDKAINDYTKSLSIQANNSECMYDLSIAYQSVNNIPNALNFALKAKQAGFQVQDAYIMQLQKRMSSLK
jgi:tetratricopeptide (TPR) repeat protein